jgi:DedD protein
LDNQLKQRLIGALVVVALAVIFVPEFLKKSDEPDEPLVNTTIPPSPKPQTANPSMTISLPPAQPTPKAPASIPAVSPPLPAAVEDPLVAEPSSAPSEPPPPPDTTDTTATFAKQSTLQTDSEPSAKGPISGEQAASTQSTKGTSVPFAEEPSTAKTQVPRKQAATTTEPKAHRSNPPSSNTQAPTEQPRKVASPKVELPKVELIGRAGMATAPAKVSMVTASDHDSLAWLVQAGSFSQSQNANELRDRLRGQGFKAFVEPTTSATRTFYRVRIGPQSSRTQSEKVLLRLQRLAGINGQVIPLSD